MIFRVRAGSTVLDFGSKQAAVQFLDNYPPHIREKTLFREANAAEIRETLIELTNKLRASTRFDSNGTPIQTSFTEWLLSRIELYDKALPVVEAYEAQLAAKEQARVSNPGSGVVNEVWRP